MVGRSRTGPLGDAVIRNSSAERGHRPAGPSSVVRSCAARILPRPAVCSSPSDGRIAVALRNDLHLVSLLQTLSANCCMRRPLLLCDRAGLNGSRQDRAMW